MIAHPVSPPNPTTAPPSLGDPAPEPQPPRYQPLPPPSITLSPTHPLTHSPLSPSDLHLLSALFQHDSDMIVAASHCGLDEVQLLLWLEQPHIQQLVRAQRRLRKLRRQIRDDALNASLLKVLTDLAHTSPNPVERRRAATTALRAITDANRPTRNGARSASEGQRARGASQGQAPRSASEGLDLSPPPRHTSAAAQPLAEGPYRADFSPDPTDAPPRTQQSALSTQHSLPDSAADAFMTFLVAAEAAGEPANLHSVLPFLDGPSLASREGAIAFKARFDHLVDQLPGATVTAEPATPEPDGLHAQKCYTLSYPDDTPLRFVFRLYSPRPASWWLEDITPLDSRPPDSS